MRREAMKETKRQRRARLQQAGLWASYLSRRTELVQEGMSPKEASRQALREVDQGTPSGQHGEAKVEKDSPPSRPLAERPSPSAFRPLPELCDSCKKSLGMPACATCFRLRHTVKRLHAAGYLTEARKLREWLLRYPDHSPPRYRRLELTPAEYELIRILPPDHFVDQWLVYRGHRPQTYGQAMLRWLYENNPERFVAQLRENAKWWQDLVSGKTTETAVDWHREMQKEVEELNQLEGWANFEGEPEGVQGADVPLA
jgi:hypothetical protein